MLSKISSSFAVIVLVVFSITIGYLIWYSAIIDVEGSFNINISNKNHIYSRESGTVKKEAKKSKEYRDQEYNFKLLIPLDFYVEKDSEDGMSAYTKRFTSYSEKKSVLSSSDVILSVTIPHDANDTFSSLDEVTGEMDSLVQTKEVRTSQLKEIEVDGLKGFRHMEDYTESKYAENGCRLSAYFVDESIVYTISLFSGSCATTSRYEKVFDQALMSFEFTD